MGVLLYLVLLLLSGLVVGALARLSLPGKDPMSILATVALGLAGSFIGGLIVWAITGGRHAAGIVVSVLCASLILYFIRRSHGGGLTHPTGPPHHQ